MCLAVPVQIIDFPREGVAKVEMDGVKLEVATVLAPNVEVGNYVLVHAGFIIEKLTDQDANEKLELFDEYYKRIGEKNPHRKEL